MSANPKRRHGPLAYIKDPTLVTANTLNTYAESRKPKQPTSKSTKRKPAPSRSSSPPPDDAEVQKDDPDSSSGDKFPNYSYPSAFSFLPFLILLLEGLAITLMFILCFIPPSSLSGGTSILRDSKDQQFVGVLRECDGTTCDPWLGSSSSLSSSGSSSGSASSSGSGSSSTSSSSSRRSHHLHSRDSSSSDPVDLPTMFLTTGIASLAALWLLIYTLIFSVIRFILYKDPPDPDAPGLRQVLKRFAYRGGRLMLLVNSILLGSVMLDCIIKGLEYRSGKGLTGSDGVGPGIALIFVAWALEVICTIIEVSKPGGKVQKAFRKLSCGIGMCGCGGQQDDEEIEMDQARNPSTRPRNELARRSRRT